MTAVVEIILLTVLVLLAALTAASETSMTAASRLKLRKLASGGSKTALAILKILETPERFFGTILVANNIIDVLIASLLTATMIALMGDGGRGIFVATAIATFLIIVSEVAAKTIAAKRAEKISIILVAPVQLLILILSPIVKMLAVITNAIVKLVGVEAPAKASLFTDDEIRWLIKTSAEETITQKEKYRMLSKVFDFSDTVVRDVMRPKGEIVSIDIDSNFDDMMQKVLESGYSRLPVYRGKPDNIIGVINMKDLLLLAVNKELVVVQDIIYTAVFIQEDKKVAELLKDFQKGHTHIAIVVNKDNKIMGIVSLEDLLEEIVGEIEDEYDVRASTYKKINK